MTINAIMVIAYRDFLKLLRDPPRILYAVIFPLLMVAVLGGSMQANLGEAAGFNFLLFTFTGVLAQTFFMSPAEGVISLLEDRENDFSQEMFVSPISRYSIIFGKILGETWVALPQGAAIVLVGLVLGFAYGPRQLLVLVPVAIAIALFGGAFGVLVLANMGSRRAAMQVFTFIMLPQYILAGVFAPIKVLPWYLEALSKLMPLRYAVDLVRGVYYAGQPEYDLVILNPPLFNMAVIGIGFAVFLVAGTYLFVRRERNR
ncbi:MAG: ABC transporter permease [Anaerolineales bacterium]|nr:ABC transporter permease [Anaerolineales bacterium]